LKDDETCLLVPRSGLNSTIVMFPFFSSPPLRFPILLFFPLSIIFTIACIVLLCAYFQGFLVVQLMKMRSGVV
jgi:hypothetical protein